jgi:hypothetical protein
MEELQYYICKLVLFDKLVALWIDSLASFLNKKPSQ